ncbi:hypothetical protein PU630_11385 [Microbacterium horticulturae]|uniref:Uncharacterized protein n=1 Tax=Microbacterium horticulturae TaxID=3028316 RepID=A0ABY8BUK2_9MICO|nr:hypothetical protein [Microbacterium sp. KACC 23027]WEG07844.1 hypothetical protein PU630_11385 [Microbacterium sp. KACC 23027]
MIVVQGALTVGLTMAFLPVGVVAVLVNAILAFVSHGINRKLFATFAIIGGALALAIGLGLMAASSSGITQVVQLG